MSVGKSSDIRVKYAEIIKPLDDKDFAIIRSALGEIGGFDGQVIKNMLEHFEVCDNAQIDLKKVVQNEKNTVSLSEDEALTAFLVCSLVSAALGEEELRTITGYDRDEFYTTIRRLYNVARNSIRT